MIAFQSPMDELIIEGADNVFYFKMWRAVKIGISPNEFRKTREQDFEMVKAVEDGLAERATRKAKIDKELARLKIRS
jgi:hypothetical protein